jgi:hypothetical protein
MGQGTDDGVPSDRVRTAPQRGWVTAAGRAARRELRYLPYCVFGAAVMGIALKSVLTGVVLGVGWWGQAVVMATRHENRNAASAADLPV